MGKNKKRAPARRPALNSQAELERATKAGIQTGVFVVRRNLAALSETMTHHLQAAGKSSADIAALMASLDAGVALVDGIYTETEGLSE